MKFMLLLGLIGHIFCGASDCLLTYAPNGKVNLTDFKDYEKSSVSFRGMPLKNLTIAMILGVAAMTLELFGILPDYVCICARDVYFTAVAPYYLLCLRMVFRAAGFDEECA